VRSERQGVGHSSIKSSNTNPDGFFIGGIGMNACPNGTFSVSEVACLRAAKSLLSPGESLANPDLQRGDGTSSSTSWAGIPPGCSMSLAGRIVYYNLGDGQNAGSYVPVCTGQPWESVVSVSAAGIVLLDVGRQAFDWLFGRCPVVQYLRDGAVHSVYRRHTSTCDMLSPYDLFTSRWDNKSNAFNTDFSIFSSLSDARRNHLPWEYCDFGASGLGYPQNCGPYGHVAQQWFSLSGSINVTVGTTLQIYSGPDCPSQARQPPLCEWTRAVTLDATGANVEQNVGMAQFNSMFQRCPVVEYKRNGHVHSIYRRLTPVPPELNAYALFTSLWTNVSNVLNSDFEMFANLEKAKWGWDKWTHCDFDITGAGLGYPSTCGPHGPLANRWFAMPVAASPRAPALTGGASLSLYSRHDCPSTVDTPTGKKQREWKVALTVSSDGSKVLLDIGAATFNRLFRSCPVVRYVRNKRVHSIYSRVTSPMRVPDPYKLFMLEWKSMGNVLNVDFGMYSTLEDARFKRNGWSYCSYDAGWGTGYPHECGRADRTVGEWFAMPLTGSTRRSNVTSGASFQIYVGQLCPSQASVA